MDKTSLTPFNIDVEKANGTLGEPTHSAKTQSTWQSQNETLNSLIEERIMIEEDTDDESGKSHVP